MSTGLVPDRPRERLLAYGSDRMTTTELLALLLGTGIRGRSALAMANQLIATVGGLARLAQAAPRELIAIPGIGAAQATRIAAAFQLSRRALEGAMAAAPVVCSAADVYERLRPRLVGLDQEVFMVLALDSRHAVTDEIEVARGCVTHVEVHPREVFRPLIRQAAAAAVVAHNHPSGDPEPSIEDEALTYRLRAVGEIVGIPILDHVIIGASGYVSMADRGQA
jgi:DNA repair protein RadC